MDLFDDVYLQCVCICLLCRFAKSSHSKFWSFKKCKKIKQKIWSKKIFTKMLLIENLKVSQEKREGCRKRHFQLTEINSKVLSFFNHSLEHDASDEFNSILSLLLDQPLQDFFFFFQWSFVNIREVGFKINQNGIFANSILLSNREILSLHECNLMSVAIVVNIFQLVKNSTTLFTISTDFVCELSQLKSISSR